MIQRVVLIKLKKGYSSRKKREQIAEHSRELLAGIPLVRGLEVAVAADKRAKRDWDLVILVRFEDLEAVEAYRVDKTHRAYVDVYLKPMLKKIRAWNFILS